MGDITAAMAEKEELPVTAGTLWALIIFSLIEVCSYFIIITKDSIKRLECLRGQDWE